jgi:hypothetical protein
MYNFTVDQIIYAGAILSGEACFLGHNADVGRLKRADQPVSHVDEAGAP